MAFKDHVEFLLALKKNQKIKNFVQQKNISLSVDRVNKNFVLRSKVFSEYISPSIKNYISSQNLKLERNEVYLISHIPFSNSKNLRKIYLEFAEQAQQYVESLNDLHDSDLSFMR